MCWISHKLHLKLTKSTDNTPHDMPDLNKLHQLCFFLVGGGARGFGGVGIEYAIWGIGFCGDVEL